MINFKSILPFCIMLALNLCCLLVLGWNFGPSSGYGLVANWGNVWLVLCAIFMIVSLILLVLMLILNIWGICSSGKGLQIGQWNMQTIVEFLMIVFGGLSLLIFAFSCASVGFVSFGCLLYILIIAAAIITYLILRQKEIVFKQAFPKFSNFEKPKSKKQKNQIKSKKE